MQERIPNNIYRPEPLAELGLEANMRKCKDLFKLTVFEWSEIVSLSLTTI